jgi:hypothetical protein
VVRRGLPHRVTRTILIGVAGTIAAGTAGTGRAGAETRTGAQVMEISTRVARAWAALTDPVTGAVAEPLPARPHAVPHFNYGTLMLADTLLRTGDTRLAARAVAIIEGTGRRYGGRAPEDPFNQLAVASLLAAGQAGGMPPDAWERVRGLLEGLARRLRPFTGHGFADPRVFDNWRLVWAAGAIQLARAGILGEPGSITERPVALRAEVGRILNELIPHHGGPIIPTPYGPGQAVSDRPDHPLAYHLLGAALLERIFLSDPALFGPEALRARERMGHYALALMAPDGDLTPSGRSLEQSWVLAAAADLGAMRATHGAAHAGRWRSFAERAIERLVGRHGTFADGTIPVVPGLRLSPLLDITDHYSSMSQYNGLTLFFLQHAAEHWPDAVAPAPADAELLVSDLGSGGPALVWGRSPDVWWAIQGRRTRPDSRATQGLVALKFRSAAGWVDRLASRPLRGYPRTDWWLRTAAGDQARLELTRASGSGRRAVITGRWMIGARTYRPARWTVGAMRDRLVLRTEPLRRGERLAAALWTVEAARGLRANARVSAAPCIVSASGRACARRLLWARPGPARLSLSAARG